MYAFFGETLAPFWLCSSVSLLNTLLASFAGWRLMHGEPPKPEFVAFSDHLEILDTDRKPVSVPFRNIAMVRADIGIPESDDKAELVIMLNTPSPSFGKENVIRYGTSIRSAKEAERLLHEAIGDGKEGKEKQ